MVRTYVRKNSRATKYSKCDLKTAVDNIVEGRLTYSASSEMYNIPRPTLYAHCKGKRGMKSESMGGATALSSDIEHRLSESLKIMKKIWLWLKPVEKY